MKRDGRLPIVTLILIAANILAAFVLLVQPDLAYTFGFRANQPSFYTALSSLFLHANVLHLLGNMVFLAAVGAAVELATGSARFGVVYFVSGLAGVGAHFLITRHALDPAPLIGASGAIAGCAAYYTIRYTSLRVPVAPRVAVPVLAITCIWVATQIAGAMIRIGTTSGVSYWSHLGGFAAGIVLSLIFRAPDLGQVKLGHEVLDRMNARGPAALAEAAKRHLERHPADTKALWDLADSYEKLNEQGKEAEILIQLLDVIGVDDQPEALRRLCHTGQVSKLAPLRRLQLADRHKADATAVSRALLRSVAEGPEDPQKPEAMIALVALDLESEPERAQALLHELVSKYPLHPTVELARKRGWLD